MFKDNEMHLLARSNTRAQTHASFFAMPECILRKACWKTCMPTPMHRHTHKHTRHTQTNINKNIHNCISGKKPAHGRTHTHTNTHLGFCACVVSVLLVSLLGHSFDFIYFLCYIACMFVIVLCLVF
jgi:hypothetical protein